jgi:hypothetical protein
MISQLRRVAALADQRAQLEAAVAEAVAAARMEGASWSALGTALGVSAQAAQQRYGPSPRQRGLIVEVAADLPVAAAAGWRAAEHSGTVGVIVLERDGCSIRAALAEESGARRLSLSGWQEGEAVLGHRRCADLLGRAVVAELRPAVVAVAARRQSELARTRAMVERRRATMAARTRLSSHQRRAGHQPSLTCEQSEGRSTTRQRRRS